MNLPPHIAAYALERMRIARGEESLMTLPLEKRRRLVEKQARVEDILRAEPVSAIIGLTALITSAIGPSVAIAGATITAGQIGGAILAIAGSFALSALSASLSGSRQAAATTLPGGAGVSTADNSGARKIGSSPIPPYRLALGTVTSSFDQIWGRSKPPFIWLGGELAAHRCGRLKGFFVNDKAVPIDGNGLPTSPPFYDGATRFIELSYRDGSEEQEIDPIVLRDITNPAMPASFRQRGHTTVFAKLNYGASDNAHKDLYGDNLNLLFTFEGARYFDPRVAGCSLAGEESWVNGETAALCIARYLYHPWPDMRLLDPGQLDWDLLAQAAEIDDAPRAVLNADGTVSFEKNHAISGLVLASDDPLQKMRELLTACDGLLIIDRGKYHVLPGAPREPAGTLHQDMLAGGFDVQLETPDDSLINTVKTEFVAPGRDYKPAVGPVRKRADLVALDGRPLETTLSLPYTPGDARAQRLAERKLNESRGGDGSGSSRVTFSGLWSREARRYKAGDVVRLWLRDLPKWNGVYQVTRVGRALADGTVQIDMQSYDKRKYDWYAPGDQQPFDLDQAVLDAQAA